MLKFVESCHYVQNNFSSASTVLAELMEFKFVCRVPVVCSTIIPIPIGRISLKFQFLVVLVNTHIY